MFFAPFLLIYALIALASLAVMLVMIEIEVISHAFLVLGLSPRMAMLALLASLVGSYINIPLYSVNSGAAPAALMANNFGVIYRIPVEYAGQGTTVAINVGGALVPILIAAYALVKSPPAIFPSLIGIVVVAIVAHHFAHPVPGLGIALPLFIAPLAAASVALILGWMMRVPTHLHVVAYVSGALGTLIGADLSNLGKIANLGAPVASIGGAGTFDGVFLTGIVAVLIAGYPFSRHDLSEDSPV